MTTLLERPGRRALGSAFLGLLGLGGALLAGCSGPGGLRSAPSTVAATAPAPRDPAVAAAVLLRTDREFASASVARGTPAAFADYSADTVTNLPANGPTTSGKPGLLARLANMGDTVLTWEPQRAEVTDSGEMGFTWGEWALRQGGATGAVRARGKYLNVWRRQADGAWKAVVDIANTASAAPLQITAPVASSPPAAAAPAPRPRAKRRPRAPD